MPLAFISAQRGFYRARVRVSVNVTCVCVCVCVKLDSRWNRETGIRGAGREMEVARGVVDALWIYCFTEPRIDATSTRGPVVAWFYAEPRRAGYIARAHRVDRVNGTFSTRARVALSALLTSSPNFHFQLLSSFRERKREIKHFFFIFCLAKSIK